MTDQSGEVIAEVGKAVAKWSVLAKRLKIPRAEQERMEPAFRLAHD